MPIVNNKVGIAAKSGNNTHAISKIYRLNIKTPIKKALLLKQCIKTSTSMNT